VKATGDFDSILTAYLLGELPAEGEAEIELRYLEYEDFYQQLMLAEEELIEVYLRGELDPKRRDRFETHFLRSPSRRERVETARALLSSLDLHTEARVSAPGARAAWFLRLQRSMTSLLPHSLPARVFATAMVALGVGLATWVWHLQTEATRHSAEKDALLQQVAQLQEEVSQHPPRRELGTPRSQGSSQPGELAARHLAAAVVLPGLTRDSGEVSRVTVPPGSVLVVLHLVLTEQNRSGEFHARLRSGAGMEVWSAASLARVVWQGSAAVVFAVPSDRLQSEDYVIELFGGTPRGTERPIEDYVIRVHRQDGNASVER
jgi:hypothetical protein